MTPPSRLTRPGNGAAEVLKAAGERELAWLHAFGEARLPRETFYRELYNYQKVDPKEQMSSLSDYLSIAPCLVPDEERLNRPTIRHPDLSPNNIFISESGDITAIIDWQHCVVLPLFLQAKLPHHFQNYGDEKSENFQPPKLPENFETMTGDEKERETETYRRRQLHFFYLGFTSRNNPLHFDVISSSSLVLRNRLYESAGRPWEGDNVSLKADLIRCIARWADVSSRGSPDCLECPLSYSLAEVEQCLELDAKQNAADANSQRLHELVGVNIDGWVSQEGYEDAVKSAATIKAQMLAAAETDEEKREVEENWPFHDHVDP
jgi:hypothetical protein